MHETNRIDFTEEAELELEQRRREARAIVRGSAGWRWSKLLFLAVMGYLASHVAFALCASPAEASTPCPNKPEHNCTSVPAHGPYIELHIQNGWQVTFDSSTYTNLYVYGSGLFESFHWNDQQGDGPHPIPFTPVSSVLCISPNCWSNSDLDWVLDDFDTCTLIANGAPEPGSSTHWLQSDFDGDGIGQPCDGDFNQSNTVNITDFGISQQCNQLATANGGVVTGSVTLGAQVIDCRNVDQDTSDTLTITDWNLFVPQFTAGEPGPPTP